MPLRLEIEKLAFGGEGIARGTDGRVVFVEDSLPGETVDAVLTVKKPNYARARVLNFLNRSPDRENPPCPCYGRCGGCQYQHASYALETAWKERQLREYTATRLGLDPNVVTAIHPSESPYRNRWAVTVHRTGDARGFGFVARDNRTVIPVEDCWLVHERLASVFKAPGRPDAKRVTFRLAGDGTNYSSLEPRLFETGMPDGTFTVHSAGFFQNHPRMAQTISGWLRERVQTAAPEVFWDFYCGCGFFGLTAAAGVPRLILVESSPRGFEALKKNALVRRPGARCVEAAVEAVIQDFFSEFSEERSAALLDPPRTGLDEKVAAALAAHGPAHIFYLSCHPGTLVRDLSRILGGRRYRVKEIACFDMFPRTQHLEALAWLERSGDSKAPA